MTYDILFKDDFVAMGLSYGELAQWLLDVHNELSEENQFLFKQSMRSNGNFEDYLYNNFENLLNEKLSEETEKTRNKFEIYYLHTTISILENNF